MPDSAQNTYGGLLTYPMITLRAFSLFPGCKVAYKVSHPPSLLSVRKALENERIVFLATQRNEAVASPRPEDVYLLGTLARLLRHQETSKGYVKCVFQATERATAVQVDVVDGYWRATLERAVEQKEEGIRTEELLTELGSLIRAAESQGLLRYGSEIIGDALRAKDIWMLVGIVAYNFRVGIEEEQKLLGSSSGEERLEWLIEIIQAALSGRHGAS